MAMDELPDNDRDKCPPRWDMSQERQFVETLLGQRFNFLLLFFSIFIAGAVQARDAPILQEMVLSLGAIIALFLAWSIWRTMKKLDLILDHLSKTHPATFTGRLPSGRHFIGFYIPPICCAALIMGALIVGINLILG
jgi:hypothetical protein